MLDDTRPTFEMAYREMVANSALYQLKCRSKVLSRYQPDEANEAARQDEAATNSLIDALCDDMTFLTNREFKRHHGLHITGHIDFMTAAGMGWPAVYLTEYTRRLPVVINGALERIVPRQGTIMGRPRFGWVKWNGNDAQVATYCVSRHPVDYIDAEQRCVEECPRPKHIDEILEKLRQTKFNYQPYILTSPAGQKCLVLRFGCAWKDVAVAEWSKPGKDRIQKIDLRLMGLGCALMSLMLWFTFLSDYWIVQALTLIVALASGAFAGLIGTHLYDRNYRTIRV